jgi:ATP-binding cassette subfamily B protein/subfamily B ATP-binding cassette protein MsbA
VANQRGSSKSRYREFVARQRAGEEAPAKAGPTDWTSGPDPTRRRKPQRAVGVLVREGVKHLRGHGLKIAFALGTLTVATLVGLALPLSTKFVFDYVVLDTPGPAGIPAWMGLPRDRSSLLWLVGAGMVGLALVQAVVHLAGRYQMTRLDKLVSSGMRRRVFQHLARLPLHRVQAMKVGGVSSVLREDAGQLGEMLFSVIYNPWRAIITFIGGLTAMALIDWRLLVGGLLLGPVIWLTHRTWINRIRPVFKAARQVRAMTDAHAAEVFGGIRVVRGFGRTRAEARRFVLGNDLMHRQELLAWWWSRVIDFGWAVFIPLASAGVLVYGGHRAIRGDLTIGDLAAFSTYLLMLLGPLEVLVSSASGLQNALAGFDRCLDVLAEPTEEQAAAAALAQRAAGAKVEGPSNGQTDPSAASPAVSAPPTAAPPDWPRGVRGRITLEGVGFTYPGQAQAVLRGIDLDAQPGEMIALVGASGSGKTTLCNLIARFYDPSEGRVLLDGQDLRSLRLEDYRQLLGIVEQEVFLFDGSVNENIGYGRRDAGPEAIRAAARAANAEEFIERLELGYDTLIGERGVRLSGGQKQRLAIARAILADPKILILDEATSNLDSESEALIQRSLATLMQGRTSFVIAHRLSTIRHASRIVVLDQGRVSEVGTHDELVARAGRYWTMLQVQLHASKDYAAGSEPARGAR